MTRKPTVALLTGLVVFTACVEDAPSPAEPELVVAPALSQSGTSGVPDGLVPNGVPYRNPTYKSATGRSGEAQLTARALMNKDFSTDLEVTTGALDSDSPPPHDMSKLQLKLFYPDGEMERVENHNKLSTGSATFVFQDRALHSNIQVQGNVTVPNASGKQARTAVVTITERVNLRPDLAARSIHGPTTVYTRHLDDLPRHHRRAQRRSVRHGKLRLLRGWRRGRALERDLGR